VCAIRITREVIIVCMCWSRDLQLQRERLKTQLLQLRKEWSQLLSPAQQHVLKTMSPKLKGPRASTKLNVHFQRYSPASRPVAPGRIRPREREPESETFALSVTLANTVKSLSMLT
jgi:hypothetical protein